MIYLLIFYKYGYIPSFKYSDEELESQLMVFERVLVSFVLFLFIFFVR